MEQNSSHNHIFQMIEMFIEFKLNVQTIFNTNLHFHLSHSFRLLHITIIVKYCKI